MSYPIRRGPRSSIERMYDKHFAREEAGAIAATMREWARMETARKDRNETFEEILGGLGSEVQQPIQRIQETTISKYSNIIGTQILIGENEQRATFAWETGPNGSLAYLGPNPYTLEGEDLLLSVKRHGMGRVLRHDQHKGIEIFGFAGAKEFYEGPKIRVLAEKLAKEMADL